MQKADAVMGCIVGGALGDASTSAFEGTDGLTGSSIWLERPWCITDDTQLTLATCEALDTGKVDPELIADNLVRWFRAKRICRVGSSTLKALRDLAAGQHWALAGCKGDRAAGNGAAMRIAPLAFLTDPNSNQGRQVIRDVCRITHHNEEAYVGALAIVVAINLALRSSKPPLPADVASALPDSVVRDRLLSLEKTLTMEDAGKILGSSGYVGDSVPLAVFASSQISRTGFVTVLEQIIALGGDTDTIASMACQIAGAAAGLKGIPSNLLERLPEHELVMNTAHRLADVVKKISIES